MAERWDAQPAWLRDALAGARERAPLPSPEEEGWLVAPAPGEFRVAVPMDRSPAERARLVLVSQVALEDDPWVNVFLVGETVDVATAADVCLEPQETGLPFAVLVETDVVGPLFLVQLGPPLGRLEPGLLDQLVRASTGRPEPEIDRRRGLPLLGRRDARWAWKDQELADMHALAYPCMQAELTATGSVLVDPAVVTWMGEAVHRVDAVRRLVRVLSSTGAAGPGGLEVVSVSDARSIANQLAALGPDAIRAMEPALAGAFRGSPVRHAELRWRPTWPTAGGRALQQRIASAAARGARSFRVLTLRSAIEPTGLTPVDRHEHPRATREGASVAGVHALEVEGVGLVQVKAEVLEEEAA